MAGLYLTGFGVVLLVLAWSLHKLNTRWFVGRVEQAKVDGTPEPSANLYKAIDLILLMVGRGIGLLLVVMGMWLFTGSL